MPLSTRGIMIDRHMHIRRRPLEDITMSPDTFDTALLSIITMIMSTTEDVLRPRMPRPRIIRADILSGSTERITRGITTEKGILEGTRLKKEVEEGVGVLWEGTSGRIERGEDILEGIAALAAEGSEDVERVEVLSIFLLQDRSLLRI